MHFKILCFLIISILNKCLGSEETFSLEEQKSIANALNNISKLPVTISLTGEQFIHILRCENAEPVEWICQNYTMSEQKSYTPQGNEIKFGIALIILGTKAFKKNACLCYKNSSANENLPENELASSAFVHKLVFSLEENKSIANVLNNSSKLPVTISLTEKQFIYVLRCENAEPVEWMCQDYSMSQQKSYTPQGNEKKFGIALIIIGTKAFKNNGCLCYKNSSTNENLAENELVSSVFVHELDDKNSTPEGSNFILRCIFKTETEKDYYNLFKSRWLLPKGAQWDKSRMSQLSSPFDEYSNILIMRNATIADSGDYTCQIVSYSLLSDRPEVDTPSKSTYAMAIRSLDDYGELVNKYYVDYLNFKANTTAKIGVCYSRYILELNPEWYTPDAMKVRYSKKFYIHNEYDCSFLYISDLEFLDSGTYVAQDTHLLNLDKRYIKLMIEDVPHVRVENVFLRMNEKACVQCKVQSYPKALVTWTFEPCSGWQQCSAELKEISSNITSSQGSTDIEFISTLTFMPISSGIIRCRANNTIGTALEQGHIIIRDTNDNMTIYSTHDEDDIKLGDNVTLTCAVFTFYFSNSIYWYNGNGLLINETENISINSSLDSYYYTNSLTIARISKSDQGKYECRAQLRNSTSINAITKIINPIDTRIRTALIAAISIFIAALFGLVTYLFMRSRRKLLDELKAAGLVDFEQGAVGQINPCLTFDEQADLLPYDRRFEFPRDKIKLGMQLGAGAFGVVFKAYAEGIMPNENKSVVAVKMVKRDAHNDVIKALVSELKIMVHLGRHLNVVNLLGAVTKNIAKRNFDFYIVRTNEHRPKFEFRHFMEALESELMVIVEYCDYGNIRSFLLSNRDSFINQIDPKTGKINASAIKQNCLYQNVLNQNSEDTTSGCLHLSVPDRRQLILNESQANDAMEMRNLAGDSENDQIDHNVVKDDVGDDFITDDDDDDDSGLSSNTYLNQGPYSNFKLDFTDKIVVTTADLISWSFQLASGMEYLSSMNVLHGDLAARNILLCKGYIVKICDFGLARSMYKDDNYKKKDDAPLPVKWLALESLSDHVFSTYTDVWSFGIVLWELFSLAAIPYPDTDSYQKLYKMLKNGYRMEKPPYASDDIYYIMLECWSVNPKARPLFHVLKEKFAEILGEEVTDHYVAMNEPYLRANREHPNLKTYLSKVEPPEELAPLSPKYVNIPPEIEFSSNDYLPMSSNSPAKETS